MKTCRFIALLSLIAVLAFVPHVRAQQHDPLNPREQDDLREVAQEPEKRLKLFTEYARARLVKAENARIDPSLPDRGKAVHDALDDFRELIDELDDNIDQFAGQRQDIRKPLKAVVQAESEFQSRLRALKEAALKDEKAKDESQEYNFVLTDALESVTLSLEDSRKTLADQEEAIKEAKKKK